MPDAMSSRVFPLEHRTREPLAETAMFWERAATPLERWARTALGASGELERARDSSGPAAAVEEEEEEEVEVVEVENVGDDDDDIAMADDEAGDRVVIILATPRRRSSAGAAGAMEATMRARPLSLALRKVGKRLSTRELAGRNER